MRRWWLGVVLLTVVGVVAWLWLRQEPAPEKQVDAFSVPASEGGLPVQHLESKWNAPVVSRGVRSVSGRVTRGGQPVAGAVVTALASHGEDVLSDLPCQCDNHCGQKLLACGCAEASGQLVELVGARTGEGAPLGRATTDAEGAFVITGLEATQLTLWADAPGGIAWRGDVASDATDVKLELSAGRRLQGKVKKTDGTAAVGAVVTAIFAEQSRFFDVVADGEGAFSIGPVPEGKLAVVAMQAGLLPDHQTIRENDAEPLSLELSVPRSLSGTVLRDGAPVAGATVKLEGMHRKRTVTTDSTGGFHLERLRPGKYTLDAETRDELAHVESFIGKSEDRTGVVISLQKGKVLTGVVTDERGAPLEGVALSVSNRNSTRRTTSDADGRFTFAVTAEGQQQTLYANKSGFLEKRVEITGQDVRVALERSAVLSGKVLGPGGALVLAFNVAAEPWRDGGAPRDDDFDFDSMEGEGTSDSAASTDGGFALDLRPGRYVLWVESPPLAPATLEATAPGEVVFTLEDGAKLRGLVFDLDGAPAAGARVSATAVGHFASPGRASTDAEGRFVIEGLAPGAWAVVADKRAESILLWSARGEVVLRNGASTEVTLRAKAGSPVAGVVISADGEPVPKARVMAWSSSADGGVEPGGMAMDTTDDQGHFRLRTLPPGPFTLTVDAKTAGRVPAARFVAPDEKIIVRLAAATTISGRVVDPEGNPVKVFSLSQQPMDTADGRFEVPARVGPMTSAIDADGFAQHIFSTQVKAGKNELGDLRLSRGRPVTGLVLDAQTQRPVGGALVDVGVTEPDGPVYLSERRGAVRTDSSGRYRLAAVDPASTWMSVTHPDYVTRNQRLGASVSTADVTLEKGATLMVKLLDARGQPVTEARVMASAKRAWKQFVAGFVPGTFVASGLPADRYTVQAQARSGAFFRPLEVEVTGGAQEVELREATDGVTVKIEVAGAMTVMLAEGTLATPPTKFSDLAGLKRPVEVRGGAAHNLLPGTWSVLGFRGGPGDGELSVNVVQITAAADQEFKLTPVWRAVQME